MALPDMNSNEFIQRYNEINPREGVFRLRRLSTDAEVDFAQSRNILSGLIWGNCEIDLGNLDKADKIFNELLAYAHETLPQPISDLLFCSYSRLLGARKLFDHATKYLDTIYERIITLGRRNLAWITDVYAEAGRKDAVLEIQSQYNKLYPEFAVLLSPSILFYAIESGEPEMFAQLFFSYAEGLNFIDANLENLDDIIDRMGQYQTHPGFKPNLSDAEYARLEKIKDAMQAYLEEEERWEESLIQEAEQRLSEPSANIISFEQVAKDLDLDSLIQ